MTDPSPQFSSPPTPPLLAIPEALMALPFATRLGWWLAYGTALGIPVDSVFQLISTMLTAAKRQLAGKHLRMTIAERLTAAAHAKAIPLAMRTLVQWIVSPDSLIRWLKRYQQRRANSAAEDSEKKKGKKNDRGLVPRRSRQFYAFMTADWRGSHASSARWISADIRLLSPPFAACLPRMDNHP